MSMSFLFNKLILNVINFFYRYHFWIYKRIYFTYKSFSEREKISFFKKNVKKGTVAVDIGANIGFYTVLLSKIVGEKGKVYSFEPDKTNFKYLKSITKGRKNVVINNLAVGPKTKNITLYSSNEINVDHQTYDNGENRKKVSVKCVSLDDFLKNERIGVVKIDIQGYDYYAIKGMQKKIEKSKHMAIVGEFWPYGLKKAGSSSNQYNEFLVKHRFKVYFEKKVLKGSEKDKWFYTDFYAVK
jgi:FkbM family methyltransferase